MVLIHGHIGVLGYSVALPSLNLTLLLTGSYWSVLCVSINKEQTCYKRRIVQGI